MNGSVEENTLKFYQGLIEELLPQMPKKGNRRAQLNLLEVIAERKAKLFKQNDDMEESQEFYRKLRGE